MHKTLHRWKNLSLIEESLTLPNGLHTKHTSIKHPGAVVILAQTTSGNVLLLNQYRPSLKSWFLEIPAGTLELNEDPLQAAKRELEEETGYSAKTWHSLGTLTPMAGFCDEVQHLYFAQDLSLTQSLAADSDEVIEVTEISIDELLLGIQTDQITDAKTISTLSKALLRGIIS
ncbi:ADP-ribose pyrophosphatase [Vibrio sp. UCD-FRSSP16_10]|uniref:NUDIX hydrolase n=1 Tax=unclassified Vibrio TaxID=2614977 RepID=UPI0007FE08BD|nr:MULTISPECIES: NUDIX hydrolase [unclassified Vibrio]OBT08001.1 ADP-ribose pyrophosphatase [Vibrio sp. UCD-FRSSP16_30]OBT17176.1 ADP-ribose pyrophosphatase [Vibrio sp. UCD-FRSSP16_10]